MKRGQVYYADPRPVVGSEQGGIRPCLIIQNNAGNLHSATVIIAPMTTQNKANIPTHVAVSPEDYCLNINTTILLEQLRTIDKSRLGDFVGRLSEGTMQKVDEALNISLALNKREREVENLGEIIHVGNRDISVKEYKGQRVVTFKDIDDVHNRPDGTARKRFNDNKKHFVEGEDYFVRKTDEARTEFNIVAPNGLVLMTESGYLMLVKSFTDDLAWEVQRKLVNEYFRAKKLSQVEMMRIQLGMIDELGDRVTALENTTTIDHGQQRVLENTVNKTVISVLGGKDSNAYKEMGRKVFSECNRDLKNYFKVNSRDDVTKLHYEDALKYAENWKPCTNTAMLISDYNAQINL